MSNALYDYARDLFLTGGLDWTAGTVRAQFVDAGYTSIADLSADQFVTAIPAPNRIGGTVDIPGRVMLHGGVADADDIPAGPTLAIGQTATALVFYKWTGALGTSNLIGFIDHNTDGSAMSRAGDGNPVSLIWSNGPTRVFKL